MIWALAAVVVGAAVYCCLVVVSAGTRRWPAPPSPLVAPPPPPISILKPLAGADEGLEANLRSFFEQDYAGAFEILFAVRTAADPAVPVAEALCRAHASVPARVLITGEPQFPNAKVWSLAAMTAQARHDLLAMADSDIRVDRAFLRAVAAEFADPRLDVATCPYRAIGGPGLWSRLEALMMNTDFLAGIVVARMLEGMKFAVGPTIVARKRAIAAIGGWESLKDFLAEDFVLGQRAAGAGLGVGLSSYVIEHRIGNQPFAANARHRLRWCRSTRRSRPAGYAGQLFTFPLPLALVLWMAAPALWPLCAAAVALRLVAAWATLRRVHAPFEWALLPPADLASFVFWVGGFFGNTILWRGVRYRLHRDGRFERTA